jgi:DNA polymerase III epsilon subunit family exonuclease
MRPPFSISNYAATVFISVLVALPGLHASAEEPSPTISNTDFVAFDTETTGLNPEGDRIIELAVVKFRNGKFIEQRSWLLNPGMPINPLATAVHHITDEMVRDQATFADIYPAFSAFIADSVLIAHNAPFDINFINAEVARLPASTKIPQNKTIDTLRLFRAWYPGLESYRLSAMADHFNIATGTFHRATDDALILASAFMQALAAHTESDTKLERLHREAASVRQFAALRR